MEGRNESARDTYIDVDLLTTHIHTDTIPHGQASEEARKQGIIYLAKKSEKR